MRDVFAFFSSFFFLLMLMCFISAYYNMYPFSGFVAVISFLEFIISAVALVWYNDKLQ